MIRLWDFFIITLVVILNFKVRIYAKSKIFKYGEQIHTIFER
jgi:hypothetical protein